MVLYIKLMLKNSDICVIFHHPSNVEPFSIEAIFGIVGESSRGNMP